MPFPAPDEYPERDGLILPRWYTRRDDGFDTRGDQLLQFCELIGWSLFPWQQFFGDVGLEVDEAGLYRHQLNLALTGRQSGKTKFLINLMLYFLFAGPQKLTLYASQNRQVGKDVFDEMLDIAMSTPALADEVTVRREAIGQELIRTRDGSSLRVLSQRQSAWRGWSASAVVLDELREMTTRETWTASQYVMRAMPNTQLWAVSTAGSPESVVLRDLVDRGRAAVGPGSDDTMTYMEWSADGVANLDPSDPGVMAMANPTFGVHISRETMLEELRSDPEGFLTESLCIWVDDPEAKEPLVASDAWQACIDVDVDASSLSRVWLGVDLGLGMEEGHLVVAGWDSDRLVVGCVESWTDPQEAAVTKRVAFWVKELHAGGVAFDPRTASGVGDRLTAAGYQTSQLHRLVGNSWPRATSRLVEFVERQTLTHAGDGELTAALLNTVRVTRPDGSWRIRRKDVSESITATVALLAAVDAAAAPKPPVFVY